MLLFLPSSSKSIPHDIKTKSGLTKLYNQKVTSVQSVERPLNIGKTGYISKPVQKVLNFFGVKTSISGKKAHATHSGVVVTLKNGKKYLVHKTNSGVGKASKTVVTSAKHMSNKWQNVGKDEKVNGKVIGDFVKKGGKNYSLWNNCHKAHDKMKGLGKRSPC